LNSHGSATVAQATGDPCVVLVGNPNVGKSVIFGLLTGQYVTVSNYPGTTVEVTEGKLKAGLFGGGDALPARTKIVDTPGINSLFPRSEDERVTLNILLDRNIRCVVQVADAKNIERALLITLQMAEAGLPVVLDLNIYDEAIERGVSIDAHKLTEKLGARVVQTVATSRTGISELKSSLARATAPTISVRYPEAIEDAVERMTAILPETGLSRRFLALSILAGNNDILDRIIESGWEIDAEEITRIGADTQSRFEQPLNYVIAKVRHDAVTALVHDVVSRDAAIPSRFREWFGAAAMHPLAGIPFLLVALYIMYEFVGVFGAGQAVKFIEDVVFGRYINPAATFVLDRLILLGSQGAVATFIHDLFVGEYGLLTMGVTYAFAIVGPVVGFFFIFFGILEDTGYLPRLTVMANRIFKVMGLNGRAVLPMVLGLGCDTMATLTARILETRKERIIVTMLLALGVPCSAQLGVILGFTGGISPVVLAVVAVTVLMQLFIVGFLAARVVKGGSSDFVIEIPPIRMPKLGNIAIKTARRVEWYLREAVPLFLIGTLALFITDRIGLLAIIERAASPIITGMLQLPKEATRAYLLGFLRRDYGAAGMFAIYYRQGFTLNQLAVALSVMVLFIPCLANFLVIIKERGMKHAMAMSTFILAYSVAVGAVLSRILAFLPITR
jgi:ferrous iron transport protein B